MVTIEIGREILDICPKFDFNAIECRVHNSISHPDLWKEIEKFSQEFSSSYKMSDINKLPTIMATRQAYKALGKEPNRYRPSAEALCRRVIKGIPLYKIDTLVDLINLVSLKSGYSIGGFDADKIEGDLLLGVGEANERFEAIGRGQLNIEGLPVYRDNIGGIGTPSSDEERTKITTSTIRILIIINGYSGTKGLMETTNYAIELLKKYANAESIEACSLKSNNVATINNIH